jgi:predicted enzyme related to lactoylglutathione lyase
VTIAQRFYGEAFNWTFEGGQKDTSGDGYLHIKAGSEMIGGLRKMGANEHAPPHWLGYVLCDDVAATVAKITQANGKVYMPTTKMDNVGTFAVVADPTGATYAPWNSARAGENDAPESNLPKPFTFCWDELLTTDPTAAEKHYETVFGWKADHMDMGPAGTYTIFKRPGTTGVNGQPRGAGGMMKAPPMVPHSLWIPYVSVENVDAISDKAKRLGANVTVQPTDIPNVGRFACWMDPQQAAIAVISFPKP